MLEYCTRDSRQWGIIAKQKLYHRYYNNIHPWKIIFYFYWVLPPTMEPKPRSPVMGCATKQFFCFTSNDVWSMSLVTSTLICFSEILAPPCPSWAHVLSEIRYELEIKSFFSSEMLKNILQIMRRHQAANRLSHVVLTGQFNIG